jgi:hypothetical protein
MLQPEKESCDTAIAVVSWAMMPNVLHTRKKTCSFTYSIRFDSISFSDFDGKYALRLENPKIWTG